MNTLRNEEITHFFLTVIEFLFPATSYTAKIILRLIFKIKLQNEIQNVRQGGSGILDGHSEGERGGGKRSMFNDSGF